jgi:ATP/maltotriose-dependent transcriptional regulator MalT/DNA-binding SARP family transcriptional activator
VSRRSTKNTARQQRRAQPKRGEKTRPPIVPAKIAAPQLTAVHPRTRLFAALDEAARRPVIWINAPGGAGKTTLAASYARARKRPCIWHQLDAGDTDIATYFHYARLAVANSSRRPMPLPDFTPEYFAGLLVFARRFFEAAAAQLPARTIVVFDNYQDVPAEAVLHQVFAEGISQIPAGMTVVILSREEPPPAFAAARARGLMAVIDAETLRLTEDESIAVARLHAPRLADTDAVRALHAQTGGWAAALVLMLEPMLFARGIADAPDSSRGAVFDYLAREFLDRAPLALQTVLLHTACLPIVSRTAARALADDPHADAALERLAAQSYLVYRRVEKEPVYQYHPLLAEFLQREFAARLDGASRERLVARAAALLEAEGHIEAAAALLGRAQQWPALIQLAVTHAPTFARAGRLQTLAAWLTTLPAPLRESVPWVCYWLGVCRMPFSFTDGRAQFEAAYRLFRDASERAGALLAWSGIVDTYTYEWGDNRSLDRWLGELDTLLAESSGFPTPEIAARVTISAFSALMWRQPSHPALPRWEQGVLEVARASPDPIVRATLGHHLLLYYSYWLGDHAKAGLLVGVLAPVLTQVHDQPLAEISWDAILSARHWMLADNAAALATVEHGLARADESGVHVMDFLLCAQGAWAALTSEDLPLARTYLARMQASHLPAQILHAAHFHMIAHVEAWKRGADAEAAEHAAAGLALVEQANVPFGLATLGQAMGRGCMLRGDFAAAARHLDRAAAVAEGFGSTDLPRAAWYARAEMALRTGDTALLLEAVRQYFTLSARRHYMTLIWISPAVTARLCAVALEHDIEPDYVRRFIRHHRLPPPASALGLDTWPWPVKIHVLGGFQVEKDGAPLALGPKSQKKPLDLLKVLIALGGANVKESQLTEILWPDADGDAAHSNFTTTLSRLRKLIGEEAIVVQESRVSLDRRHLWVDALSLEQIMETAEHATNSNAERAVTQALSLYRGPLLAGEEDAPWALGPRERVRSRFIRLISRAAEHLVNDKRHSEAATLCRRGIELDELAEEFYRGLMICHIACGERAQAASAYRRYEAALARTFGDRFEPSPAIQALYRDLGAC